MAIVVTVALLSPFLSSDAYGETKKKIGQFKFYSADSSSFIRLQLAAQMRMQFTSIDQGEGNDRDYDLVLKARRIRPILSGQLLDPRLTFQLHLSTAPGSLELMDLYFNYKYRPYAQIRAGQFKVPFTRYRTGSYSRLALVEWALVTKYFGAERQWGFALHNGYETMPRLGYVLGVFSGANARASHAVGLPKLFKVELESSSNLAGDGAEAEFQPELFAACYLSSPDFGQTSDVDEIRGTFRYQAGISGGWDLDPVPRVDLAGRLAPEVWFKYQGWVVAAVGYAGWSDAGENGHTALTLTGFVAQAAYRWCENFEFAGRWARVDIDDELRLDVSEYLAQSLTAIAEFEQEMRVGFNVYVDRHNLKIQNDAGIVQTGKPGRDRSNVEVRSQVQLMF